MRPDLSRLFCSASSYVPLTCGGWTPLLLYVFFLGYVLHTVPVWFCVFCRTPAVMALQHLSMSMSSHTDSSGHLPNSPSGSRESRLACSQPVQVEACGYCTYLHFP